MTVSPWRSLARAFRELKRRPSYPALAIVVLVAGVAPATAFLSLINWAFLRPVPGIARSGELLAVRVTDPESGGRVGLPNPSVERWLAEASEVQAGAAFLPLSLDVTLPEQRPVRVASHIVTGGYFETLGVRPSLGRVLTPDDARGTGSAPVAVISHRLWQTVFGGDPNVLGRMIEVNQTALEVVGVAAREFKGPSRVDDIGVWLPAPAITAAVPRLPAAILSMERARIWQSMVVRPNAGVPASAVRQQLLNAAPELETAGLELAVAAERGLSPGLRSQLRRSLAIVGALVGLLVFLTVLSLVNLTLARTLRQRREVAVRRALGANLRAVLREPFWTAVVVGGLGSAVSIAAGLLVFQAIDVAGLLPASADATALRLDWRVVFMAAGLGLAIMVVTWGSSGLAAARFAPSETLRPAGGGRTSRVRRGLVAAQIMVSVALVSAAGLAARSLGRLLMPVETYDPDRLTLASVNPGAIGYDDAQADRLFRDLVLEIEELPGVEHAGFSWLPPMGPQRYQENVLAIGRAGGGDEIVASANMISPGWLGTMGIELLEGRDFSEAEYGRSERPDRGQVLVNSTLANLLFPGSSALGRELRMTGRRESAFEIIGVVADTRLQDMWDAPGPALFDPFGNGYRTTSATFAVRGTETEGIVRRIGALLEERNPALSIGEGRSMAAIVADRTAEERTMSRVAALLAGCAVALAAVGLFALMSQAVLERTREFGVRSALGADPARLMRLVLWNAFAVIGVGLASGLTAAFGVGRLMQARLFETPPFDPVVLLGAAVVFLAVGATASIPAWWAARIDPAAALRADDGV